MNGLSYTGKLKSIGERKYKDKDWNEKVSYNLYVVTEWATIILNTNNENVVNLETKKYYTFPCWVRPFSYKDKTSWEVKQWLNFFLRNEEIEPLK